MGALRRTAPEWPVDPALRVELLDGERLEVRVGGQHTTLAYIYEDGVSTDDIRVSGAGTASANGWYVKQAGLKDGRVWYMAANGWVVQWGRL